jgi:hypothetical protein
VLLLGSSLLSCWLLLWHLVCLARAQVSRSGTLSLASTYMWLCLVRAHHHLWCHVVQGAHACDGMLLAQVNGQPKICVQAERRGVTKA